MTNNEEEDEEYYKLVKALEEYNSDIVTEEVLTKPDVKRHPKGSLIQKILDPFAGARINEEGILCLELTQEDIKTRSAEQLREIYEKFKANNEEDFECDDSEDPEEGRVALLKEIDADKEFFANIDTEKMDRQFAAFLEHEDYSFVKDMKKHYSHELQKSEAQRILEKIPAHAFWDIKKPQRQLNQDPVINRTNPNRPRNHNNWFEAVEYDRNMDIHNGSDNLRAAMSEFRRY